MKKFTFLVFAILLIIRAQAQENTQNPAPAGKRFFVGFSYSYLAMDMKLSSLSLHSNWYGVDQGTHDLTNEEIDDVNSVVDRTTTINYLNLEAGMTFIENPDSKWYFKGKIKLGIAGTRAEVQNTGTDSLEYKANSDFSKPCIGLGFDVGYKFDNHWRLSVLPCVMGTINKTTKIDDLVNPVPINFTAVKEDKNQVIYLRSDVLAGYTTGPVTISLGPGFYYCWSKHEYTSTYTNVETSDVITEKVNSTLVPRLFVDASLAVEWRIIDALTLNAHAGIGNDLLVDAGIHYNF